MSFATTANALPAGAPGRSAGLWRLAWRRLVADRVAVVSMVIVVLFVLLTLGSGAGLIADRWGDEVAVGYAPPGFVGPAQRAAPGIAESRTEGPLAYPGTVVDPLADELRQLRATLEGAAGPAATRVPPGTA